MTRADKIIATSGFFLPVIGVISPVNIASILFFTMLASFSLYWKKRANTHPPLLWYALLLFLAYGGISIFWTLDQREAVNVWLRLMVIAAAGYVVLQMVVHHSHSSHAIGRIMRWLVVGHTIALILLGLDIVLEQGPIGFLNNTFSKTPFHFEKLNRGATVIALTLWPCLLGIRQMVPGHRAHMCLAAAMIAATASILFSLESLAAIVSLCVGLCVFAYAYWIRFGIHTLLKAGLLIVIISIPLISQFLIAPEQWAQLFPSMPDSMLHRLYIWEFVADKATENPVFGWGLKSSKYIPGGWQTIHESMALLPLHPHNMVLQIWLELGIVGLVMLTVCLLAMLHSISKGREAFERPVQAVYYSVFLAFMATSLTAFGFWQNWWLCAAVMAAAVTRYVAGAISTPSAHVPTGKTLQEAPTLPVDPA